MAVSNHNYATSTFQTKQNEVWYNGHLCKIAKEDDKYMFIEYDGKCYKVDKNDLFGLNNEEKIRQEVVDYNNKKIAEYEQKMKENNNLIKFFKAKYVQCEEAIKENWNKLSKYVCQSGLKSGDSYENIQDSTLRAKAEEAYLNYSDAKFDKISASNNIYSACLTGFDFAIDKGKLEQLNILAQA